MSARDAGMAVVVGLAVLGLAFAIAPGLAPGLPGPLLTVVGAVAVLFGVAITYGWFEHDPTETAPSAREDSPTASVPGADLDRLLSAVPGTMTDGARLERSRIRREFESIAVEALVHHHGCSESEAYRQLREGTWTDDPQAADFFAARPYRSGETGGLVTRGGTEDQFRRGARRAAAELAGITGVEPEGER